MAELETRVSDASVEQFLSTVSDADKRAFAERVGAMMAEASGAPAKMWGSSIVGYGSYTYRYASGRSGDWMRIGYSPRKDAMTLYIMPGFDAHAALLARLGTYKTGKSCLYIKREADVDLDVLRELIEASLAAMSEKYPEPAQGAGAAATKKTAKKRPSSKASAKKRPSSKASAKKRPAAKKKPR